MKSLRVLIVDDNPDGADSLGLLVEELGHNTHVTYGGRQALEVATVFRPDLMLVDLAGIRRTSGRVTSDKARSDQLTWS